MGGRKAYYLIFLLFGLFLCSGSGGSRKEALGQNKELGHTTKRDISNPTTTVPIINLTNTPSTSTTPLDMNPAASASAPTTATSTPISMAPPVSGSESWCVASQSASQIALQVALDYACGYGGADCSAIQVGGNCYNPTTLRNHASYAFNKYYQNNPIPASCNFGGTAVITSTDPSYVTCQFSSISTSSSVLNTTNESGSAVFGSQPTSSSGSAAAMPKGLPQLFMLTFLMVHVAAAGWE
ncbi:PLASMODESMATA CALLOSE-BINDING PROTEIN 5 isoform X2 [Malania oleifera]|uniref:PLASMODESMATA CALLOSE-BINDING PROTEIN 5 isoform X2 n=1 Tax=Malania oleifera TaxID=397392 RepID=UPI0025AE4AC3|nr:PLASMODESMATA CALLOSE-BINDING PROTEIN 5 isoform X2 [Malania oleifera]